MQIQFYKHSQMAEDAVLLRGLSEKKIKTTNRRKPAWQPSSPHFGIRKSVSLTALCES